MDSINDYARAFDQALEKKLEFANFNRDIQHATVIICIAFHHAQNRVRLLSNQLDPILYGGMWFMEEARGFLNKGGNLEILVEKAIADDHPIFSLDQGAGKLSVKRVPDQSVKSYKFNFMLVDEIGYRFESDREKPEAIVSFGRDNTEQMNALNKFFETLWKRSSGI